MLNSSKKFKRHSQEINIWLFTGKVKNSPSNIMVSIQFVWWEFLLKFDVRSWGCYVWSEWILLQELWQLVHVIGDGNAAVRQPVLQRLVPRRCNGSETRTNYFRYEDQTISQSLDEETLRLYRKNFHLSGWMFWCWCIAALHSLHQTECKETTHVIGVWFSGTSSEVFGTVGKCESEECWLCLQTLLQCLLKEIFTSHGSTSRWWWSRRLQTGTVFMYST